MKTQLSSLQRNQTFLRILIFTLVTVIIWVGLTLFRTQNTTGISPELLRLAEPLNPNINVEVLGRVEQKRAYQVQDLADFPIYTLSVDRSGEERVTILSATGEQFASGSATPSQQPIAPPTTTPSQAPQTTTPASTSPANTSGTQNTQPTQSTNPASTSQQFPVLPTTPQN
jgi:hypothetical protein